MHSGDSLLFLVMLVEMMIPAFLMWRQTTFLKMHAQLWFLLIGDQPQALSA